MNDNKLIAKFMSVEYTGTRVKDYDTSWDWLIPVVNKIEEGEEGVPIQLLDCSLYTEIHEVYQAVVEFINEHNKYICGSCREHCSEYTYSEDRDVDECNNCKTYNNEK